MLVALPILDTEVNGRTVLTKRVLSNLLSNVLRKTDRVVVSDNGSCEETLRFYELLRRKHRNFSVIHNGKNLGIAEATNVAWRQATPDEIVVKMDNDCLIHTPGWPALVDYVFSKDDSIGILGLKRKDLAESPTAEEPHYRSTLYYLNHNPGEKWVVLEAVNHVMGTCYAFNPKMRKEFGYLMQPGSVYGFDDALAAVRAHKLGYKTCFLPQIEIDHLDPPGMTSADPYTQWKSQQAGQYTQAFHSLRHRISTGSISSYYNPFI
jgi:GT2 family glycosyltransferase